MRVSRANDRGTQFFSCFVGDDGTILAFLSKEMDKSLHEERILVSEQRITINLGGAQVQLREPHDFDWLLQMGRVTHVFDQQDSGCLSFGVETDTGRLLVKYAGARPIHYAGEPGAAVEALKQAVPRYQALRHPNLVELLDHFPLGAGYATVFGWFDGLVLRSPDFPGMEKYNNPLSPYYRFRQLPLVQRLESLDAILAFHEHVEQQGYVAVDLYDGSVLYDFDQHQTKICDIDLYQRRPFANPMGRLWGSSRFMSPEEYQLGAVIDERTNVFNLGAMAFCLLGGDGDRDYGKWEAGEALYQVAARAISPERDRRYASVAEYSREWRRVRAETVPGTAGRLT